MSLPGDPAAGASPTIRGSALPPPGRPTTSPATVRTDVRRLWGAYAISEAGHALSYGALPLIAILLLDASDLQITLLAVLSGSAAAAIALPLGPWIEYRPKRPVMIAADVLRCVTLASVPIAAATGALTYPHLCAVAVVQTASTIAFGAASQAHLKNLVPAADRVTVTGRFDSTQWVAHSIGPPLGGLLVTWLGVTTSIALDAVSFLLSALGIRRLRTPEPPPPRRTGPQHRLREVTDGWRYIAAHPGLRALFINAMIFGGCIMAAAPVVAVLMLRDLGLTPAQYGLALGVPCLGGVAGSLLSGHLTRRFSLRTVVLTTGVGRTLWMALIPLAPPGTRGLLVIIVAETLLLLFAGAFNPAFAAYRMHAVSDDCMARVITAWSVSSRTVQPVFIAAVGALAAATSARTAILITAAILLSSTAFLPWRRPDAP